MKPTIYTDNYDGTPCLEDQLHDAILGQNDITEVKQLITENTVKQPHSRTNKPPLIYAALMTNLAAFKLLLDNGATVVDAITDDGFTALDYCPLIYDPKRDFRSSLLFIYEHTIKVINAYRNKPNPTLIDNTNRVLLSLSVIRYLHSKDNKSQADLDDIEKYLQYVLNTVKLDLQDNPEPVIFLQIASVLSMLGKVERANHFFNLAVQRYKSLNMLDKGINTLINSAITLIYAYGYENYAWASFNCYLSVIQLHLDMQKNDEALQKTNDCLSSLAAFLSHAQKSKAYRQLAECFSKYQLEHLLVLHANKIAIDFAIDNQNERAVKWFELGLTYDKEKLIEPEVYLGNLIKVAIDTRNIIDAQKWLKMLINISNDSDHQSSELSEIESEWKKALGPQNSTYYYYFNYEKAIILFDLAKYIRRSLNIKDVSEESNRDWYILIFDLYKVSRNYYDASEIAEKIYDRYLSLEKNFEAAQWCQAAAECRKLDYFSSEYSSFSLSVCILLSFKAGKLFQEIEKNDAASKCYSIVLEGINHSELSPAYKLLTARCAIEHGLICFKQERKIEARKSLHLATETIFPITMDDKSLFTCKEDGTVTIEIHPAENQLTDPKLTTVFFIEYYELVYHLAIMLDIQKIEAWAAFHCVVLSCRKDQANTDAVSTYLKFAVEYFKKHQKMELVAELAIFYMHKYLQLEIEINHQHLKDYFHDLTTAADLYFSKENIFLIKFAVSVIVDVCYKWPEEITLEYPGIGCKYLLKLYQYYLEKGDKEQSINVLMQLANYCQFKNRYYESDYYFNQASLLCDTSTTEQVYHNLLVIMLQFHAVEEISYRFIVYRCLISLLTRNNNFDQNFIKYVDYMFDYEAARGPNDLLIIYRGLLFFKEKNQKYQASYIDYISANNINLSELDKLIDKLKAHLFPEKSLKDRVLDALIKQNGYKSLDEFVVKQASQLDQQQLQLQKKDTALLEQSSLIIQQQQEIAELEQKVKALEAGEKTSVAAQQRLLIWQSAKNIDAAGNSLKPVESQTNQEVKLARHIRRKSN